MKKIKRTIQELDLMDDFLFSESMRHKETGEPLARLIIERATGVKIRKLVIECEKVVNGIDTDRHGIRMDVSVSEIDTQNRSSELVRLYDIEPNNSESSPLPRRSRYYQSLIDVKLLETGTDYDKLPDLWSIWILPYDPFCQNQMIYFVKNMVEEFEEIDYNDGVRKIFLYTSGEHGGTPELKVLLHYLQNTCIENAVDSELKTLHSQVEHLKSSKKLEVKYMHMREMMDDLKKEARAEGLQEGRKEGERKMAALTKLLLDQQAYQDLTRAANDEDYRRELFLKHHI